MNFTILLDSDILAIFVSIFAAGPMKSSRLYFSKADYYSLVPILTCTDFVFE